MPQFEGVFQMTETNDCTHSHWDKHLLYFLHSGVRPAVYTLLERVHHICLGSGLCVLLLWWSTIDCMPCWMRKVICHRQPQNKNINKKITTKPTVKIIHVKCTVKPRVLTLEIVQMYTHRFTVCNFNFTVIMTVI